jgi:hypothetical protein
MPGRTLHLFSPFSLKHGSNHKVHRQCQRVVWYAESRWRQALIKISKADVRHRSWMQRALQEELVSLHVIRSPPPTHRCLEKWIVIIVGQQAAIGQPLDLPIFVRSLAESLTFARPSSLPLEFDESLLAALDNGVEPDSPAALVAEYAYDWWNRDAEPCDADILSRGNIKVAVELHSKQRGDEIVPPIPTIPGLDVKERSRDCPECAGYRDLASEVIAELQDILQITEAAETAAQNRWETDTQ